MPGPRRLAAAGCSLGNLQAQVIYSGLHLGCMGLEVSRSGVQAGLKKGHGIELLASKTQRASGPGAPDGLGAKDKPATRHLADR
jgi:hypothetical protein